MPANRTRPRALVCVDFDGTVVGPGSEDPFHQDLATCLGQLRDNGVIWAVATGRSLFQAIEGIKVHAVRPYPEYLISSERHLFERAQLNRWLPLGKWNNRCAKDHRKLFKRNSRFFAGVRDHIEKNTSARYYDTPQEPACIVARSDAEMDSICGYLETRVPEVKNLSYERNSVYLRFSHSAYNKGLTLTELARQLGVPSSDIFVAGDNHNDTSMLHPSVGGMLACPSNAVPEVKETVAANGGFVSAKPAGLGTLDALRHYFGDLAT